MIEHLLFTSRDEFRNWLEENCLSSGGIWLLFGKAGGPKTVGANEALKDALCFGWIDGQMKSIDNAILNTSSRHFLVVKVATLAGQHKLYGYKS